MKVDTSDRRKDIVSRATVAKELLIEHSMEPDLDNLDLNGFSFKLGVRFQKTEALIENLFLKWDDVRRVGIHLVQGIPVLYVHFENEGEIH